MYRTRTLALLVRRRLWTPHWLEGKRRREVKMSKSLNDICDVSESASPPAVVSHEPREVSVLLSTLVSYMYIHQHPTYIYVHLSHRAHVGEIP